MRCSHIVFVLELKTDIILSREEDAISPSEYGINGRLCFYDVLADYYVQVPENGKPILDLIVQLWSQSFASHVFSLLFHKWVGCVHDLVHGSFGVFIVGFLF